MTNKQGQQLLVVTGAAQQTESSIGVSIEDTYARILTVSSSFVHKIGESRG